MEIQTSHGDRYNICAKILLDFHVLLTYQGYDENGKMWHDNKNITRALSIAAGLNILGQIHKKLLAFQKEQFFLDTLYFKRLGPTIPASLDNLHSSLLKKN